MICKFPGCDTILRRSRLTTGYPCYCSLHYRVMEQNGVIKRNNRYYTKKYDCVQDTFSLRPVSVGRVFCMKEVIE